MPRQRKWTARPGTIIIEIVWREGDDVEQAIGTNLDAVAPEPREPVLVVGPVGMQGHMGEGRVLEKHATDDDRNKRLIVEIPQRYQPYIGGGVSLHRTGRG